MATVTPRHRRHHRRLCSRMRAHDNDYRRITSFSYFHERHVIGVSEQRDVDFVKLFVIVVVVVVVNRESRITITLLQLLQQLLVFALVAAHQQRHADMSISQQASERDKQAGERPADTRRASR